MRHPGAQPDKQEFLALIRRAIHLDPGNTAAMLRLARHHVAAGELAEAEAVLRTAQKLEPKSAQVAGLLADALDRLGRRPAAVAVLRAAIAAAPRDPICMAGSAICWPATATWPGRRRRIAARSS